MAELKYWVWLSQLRGLGRNEVLTVLDHFGGSPEGAYFAEEAEYRTFLQGDVSPLLNKNLTEARKILADCDGLGVHILTLADAGYPTRLRNIYDPPLVLYVLDKLPAIDEEAAIAIVGTRSATPYGLITAERIGYEIARYGGLVLSGLAAGIDSAAAKGALRGGGRVVGFLGCGIDQVYPTWNRTLYEDVIVRGALVSEYPPGVQPSRQTFPARNRILSGMSVAVTVVEAPKRSGALITAGLALEQGRDVYAVPGNVDAAACEGCNNLLREGAQVALRGRDVIEPYLHRFQPRLDLDDQRELVPLDGELAEKLLEKQKKIAETPKNIPKTAKEPIDNQPNEDYILISCAGLPPQKLSILAALNERLHVDEVVARTGLPAAEVLSTLTMLELEGAVTQEPGKFFVPHFKITD